MATIVTQTADNAYKVQDAFRAANRDNYPLPVYQAIVDFISDETTTESEYYQLDVVAWACDISETTLDDLADEDDLADLVDLVNHLQAKTTVLYVDEDAESVWHIAY